MKVEESSIEEAVKLLTARELDTEEFVVHFESVVGELLDSQPDLADFIHNILMYCEMVDTQTMPVKQLIIYMYIVMQSFKIQGEVDEIAKMFRKDIDNDSKDV